MTHFQDICRHHGLTTFRQGKTHKRCLECAKKAVMKRRDALKKFAIEHLGGKCVKCGYYKCIRALEFHHLDPKQKDFAVSRANKSWERVKKEIEKCILVCANCHREIHSDEHNKN